MQDRQGRMAAAGATGALASPHVCSANGLVLLPELDVGKFVPEGLLTGASQCLCRRLKKRREVM